MSRGFKSYFLSVENNKKAGRLWMELSLTSNTVTRKGITKAFISTEYFLNFFWNLYIPSWLRKSFKFLVLRLLEDMSLSKILPPAEGNYPFPPKRVSENLFFTQQKGGGLWSWKMTKVKLGRVLVTSFDKSHHQCNFTFFVSVLLYHNLDSSCAEKITWKIKPIPTLFFNHIIHHMPN